MLHCFWNRAYMCAVETYSTFLLYKGEVKLVSLALGSISPADATLIFLQTWSNHIITAHFLKGEIDHEQQATKHKHLQVVHAAIHLTVSGYTQTVGIFVGAACSRFHLSLHVDYSSHVFGLTVQFAALLSYGKQDKRDPWGMNLDEMHIYYLFRSGVTKFGPGGPVSLQSFAPTLIKHTWSS